MTTSTQIAIRKLPGYEEDIKKDILASARALFRQSRGLDPETGEPTGAASAFLPPDIQLADLSEGEKAAIKRAYAGIESYLPMMQAGSDTIGTGISAMNKGIDVSALGVPTIGASMLKYDPTSVSSYMNPYTEQVIKQNEQDLLRQQQQQQGQIDARAVGQGAFGGSRQAVAQAELGRNTADQQARMAAQLRNVGFQQAQKASMDAFERQQQRLQQAGRLYGALGQGLGSLGTGLTKSGLSQASLGEAQQRAQLTDLGMLAGYGGLERGFNQAGLDAYRENLMNRQMEPYRQLGFYSDFLSGVPSTSATYGMSYQPPASRASQMFGIGMGLGGLNQSGYFGGGGGGIFG